MNVATSRWGLLWHSANRTGTTRHLMFENGLPLLFRTRAEARRYAKQRWGYILARPDLKAEPFGWRQPIAVKVRFEVVERR